MNNRLEQEYEPNSVGPLPKSKRFRVVDLIAFIVCFFIAFGVWLYVIGTENEDYEYTFKDVVVKYDGVSMLQNEHGLSIISENEVKVDITVKGSRSEIVRFNAEDFFAHVDVGSITSAGTHSVNVIAELPEGKFSIVSTYPSAVNVFVDETATKNVPIIVDLRYSIADSLTLHDPAPAIDTVEVVGPKSRLDLIKCARVLCELGTVTTSITTNAVIKLYDDAGNVIENPYIKPSVGDVTVKIRVTTEKKVNLVPSYTAADLAKYDYKVTFAPESLTVIGDPTQLAELNDIAVVLGDITNVGGGSIQAELAVSLPANISLVDGDKKIVLTYRVEKTPKDNGAAEKTE